MSFFLYKYSENLERQSIRIKMEIQALRKETDPASRDRLEKLEHELQRIASENEGLLKQWSEEKASLDNIKKVKERLERANLELQRYQRQGNLEKASELMYSTIPELKKQLPTDKVIRIF